MLIVELIVTMSSTMSHYELHYELHVSSHSTRIRSRTHAACAHQSPRAGRQLRARAAAHQHDVHVLEVEKNTRELQVERHDGARAEEAEESVVERRGRGGGAGRAEA